ncbi:MAG: hypothetical protein KDK44_05135 [Chlamydiia bacterium]|nr:hypothetical protein [Chlamydiia bacterium]MCP5509499.1 hypothetical protein [Chlamydiales bacterium]HPE84641.1 hypothetical protein [Chlamydiales bacterium]
MKKKIIYIVVAVHLALVLSVAISLKKKPAKQTMPIAVRTFVAPKPMPSQPAPKNQQVVAQAKPKAAPKAPARKKARDVMSDLQKNMAKIETKRDSKQQSKPKPVSKAKSPAKQESPQVAKKAAAPTVTPQYPLLLVQKLKSALHLPEEGDVKLELILKNSGEVIKVNVLSSLSPDNALYLENEITKMRFPVFTADLTGKKEHTFTLTFRHDD